jgi:hypothetical protein
MLPHAPKYIEILNRIKIICIYIYIYDMFFNLVLYEGMSITWVCTVDVNGSMSVVSGEKEIFQIFGPLV